MSDTQFTDKAPEKGNRVEITYSTSPTPYVVKTWVDGQLVDARPLGSRADADKYYEIQRKRYL